MLSLPAWGVWIEIIIEFLLRISLFGRSPHGECGLKYTVCVLEITGYYVAPRMGSVD